MELRILYEDEYLIAVDKPYGLLSEGEGEDSLITQLTRYLKESGKPAFIKPVHRLDRTTRGAIIYAKTSECARRLCEMIRSGTVRKIYTAKIEGIPEYQKGYLEDMLFYDRRRNKSFVVKNERKGVKRAKLYYEVLSVENIEDTAVSEVKVELLTGRTHQIRVQFASRGMPIVGDRRYGSTIRSQILLFSSEIRLKHPFTGEELVIDSSFKIHND